MRPIFLLLFCTFFTTALISQHSYIDLSQVYADAKRNKSVDSITYLLQLDSTQVNNYERADLYTMRGILTINFNKKKIRRRSKKVNPLIKFAYADLSSAIEQIDDEKDKLSYVYSRFRTLKKYKPRYTKYQSDLNLLSSKGYKKDNKGIGISALSKYDGTLWLGAELSIFSGFASPYKLIDDNNKLLSKKTFSVSASAFVIGFTKNIENKLNDIKFSLLRIEAPLFIDILQFGRIYDSGRKYWYYRPEIGIGYYYFHISAGYNFFFKTERPESISNAMINFRIKHTF